MDAPERIAPSVVFIRTSTDAIGQALEVSLAALTLLATKKIRLRIWRCHQSVSLVCKIIDYQCYSMIIFMILFCVGDVQADIDYLLGDRSQQQRSSALFLLKLKEERRLTQVAIDDIVTGIESVLENCTIRVKAGVRAKLASSGIDPNDITGLDDVFLDMVKPFAGLETGFKQEYYFKDVLGLLVSLVSNIYNTLIQH